MKNDNLAQRKSWFRFFPDGTIEFTVITRVLAIMFLTGVAMVSSAQRPAALTALSAVIWLDYAITLWWVLQIGNDVRDVAYLASPKQRIQEALRLAIPSIVLILLIAPWPELLIGKEADRTRLMRIVLPVLAVAFVAAALFAKKTLEGKGLGSRFWQVLLLIPGLHWFALHRLIGRLQNQIGSRLDAPHSPARGWVAADVTLVVCLICWSLAGLSGLGGLAHKMLEGMGIASAALFAIIDLALMEQLQRQYVTLIRKL